VLVAVEVALALVLATSAGLLLRSYVLLKAIVPGFSTDHVLTMQLWFPGQGYNEARRIAFLAHVLERIRSIPLVEAAGAASWLPLNYDALMSSDVQVKGQPRETVNTLGVTPGYFQSIGMSLVAGRFLREGDQNAFLVNEAFCKRYGLQSARAIGEQIALYGKPRTVAGVVGDIRDLHLEVAAEPVAFVPYADLPTPFVGLAVRTAADPKPLAAAVRAEIRAVEPGLAVGSVQTMEEVMSGAVAQPRFNLALLGAFAWLAVGLAVVGVYGVITYVVAQRRNEIGVRMALGAQSAAVVRYIMLRGMTPVVAGLAIGLGVALVATRLLRSMLYGIGPTDPAVFASAVLLLGAAALGACWLPARRASRIDPVDTLRHE
jgi:predicted permease